MDCFFAAVEVRENPTLSGKPVAVGGTPEGRGVVATCSYEARKYGVHSAMPMATALSKCPGLVVLPVNMTLYREVSADIQAIFREVTELVEPLSLDEAFLDVSGLELCSGSATLIAQEIRQRIFDSQQLTASAGIAPNKFLAKIASDWNKPNGQKVIRPEEIDDFVSVLPVRKIFGVGKVTAGRMQKLGIETCADLQQWSIEALCKEFGSFGPRLYELSRGIDHREVKTSRNRKSLSVEDTFATDLPTLAACQQEAVVLFEELQRRFSRARKHQSLHPKALFVKLRFNDFTTTTVQTRGSIPELSIYEGLIATAWQRGEKPVRLIGLGLQFASTDAPEQLKLDIL